MEPALTTRASRREAWRGRVRSIALVALALVPGCASLPGADAMNQTVQGDPPWRAGRLPVPQPSDILVLPIVWQAGPDGPIFAPSSAPGSPVAEALARMDRFVADMPGLTPTDAIAPVAGAPDVRFGCRTDPIGDCEPYVSYGGRPPELFLGARAPDAEWAVGARDRLASGPGDALLVVALELTQYWPRQIDARGRKAVVLGSGHRQELPWLTSLDDAVQVLQITAALVDATGKVTRIGAEGLVARRSSLLVNAAGGQELLSDEDVRTLFDARRDDLPGRPLVWETALRDLIASVTGRGW